MKRLMMILVALVALGVVPFASAQEKAGESQVTEMSFEGDVVEAQFLRPDQGVTEGLIRKKKNSLIKLRTDFVDEILKSAEDL
ncbi:MAG TPA: hypothetical protein PKG98_05150 [Myxococcota bacterium]|nr:hypothetical protein [Myxococcota bacterium]